MHCPSCNSENSGDASFCEQCGAKLELRCSNCKAPVSQGARFCKKCGVALGGRGPVSAVPAVSEIRIAPETAATETVEGERKTVTALFADIKGSQRGQPYSERRFFVSWRRHARQRDASRKDWLLWQPRWKGPKSVSAKRSCID